MVEANKDQAQELSDAYTALCKAVAEDDHAKVAESTTAILQVDTGEKTDGAKRAYLTSLIKRREFKQATEFLAKHDYTKKNCQIEAAYILHRQD